MKLSDCSHGSIVKIQNTTYRVYRLEEFPCGTLGKTKAFARLQPCAKVNPSTGLPSEHWWDNHHAQFTLHNWDETCKFLDTSVVPHDKAW
jgi:hypothetical protein